MSHPDPQSRKLKATVNLRWVIRPPKKTQLCFHLPYRVLVFTVYPKFVLPILEKHSMLKIRFVSCITLLKIRKKEKFCLPTYPIFFMVKNFNGNKSIFLVLQKFLFLWKQLQLFTVCCHSERTVKMRILVFRTGSALHEKREYSFPVPEACYVKTWIVMGKCTLWLLVKLSLCLKIFLKLHYHEQLTVRPKKKNMCVYGHPTYPNFC